MGQILTALVINLDILKTQLSGDDLAELRSRLEDSISLVGSIADAKCHVGAAPTDAR
ncbi:MAG: hypothetical protein H0U97_08505 [Gammaproteobacteria bacterium]|nr:hypothetical protein [Gammaproteobacteria bacterium]